MKKKIYNTLAVAAKKDSNQGWNKVFIGKVHLMDNDIPPEEKMAIPQKPDVKEDLDALAKKNYHRTSHEVSDEHRALRDHYNMGPDRWENGGQFPDNDKHAAFKDAIAHYTSSGYQPINHNLFNGRPHTEGNDIRTDAAMREGLKSFKTPRKLFVHSGIKQDPRTMEQSDGHIKMQMPAFTSTSINPAIAEGFSSAIYPMKKDGSGPDYDGRRSSHTIHLEIPEGAHGAYVDHHSMNAGEKEFVLHPGARIHLDPQPKHTRDTFYGQHFHWHGKLVHDGVKDLTEEKTMKDKLLEAAIRLKELKNVD